MALDQKARRLALLSGKGGVGKTVITANLAAMLAAGGTRVLVIDADIGMANIDVLLGVHPDNTLRNVLENTHRLDQVIIPTPAGFDLLPGGSGALDSAALTGETRRQLEATLAQLDRHYEFILFDIGAGIGETVLHFASLTDEILLVVTPEPTSLTDAYATIKVLARRYGRTDVRLIVNRMHCGAKDRACTALTAHLQGVVDRFVSPEGPDPVKLSLLAVIPEDSSMPSAVRRQRLLAVSAPDAPATLAIAAMARALSVQPALG